MNVRNDGPMHQCYTRSTDTGVRLLTTVQRRKLQYFDVIEVRNLCTEMLERRVMGGENGANLEAKMDR